MVRREGGGGVGEAAAAKARGTLDPGGLEVRSVREEFLSVMAVRIERAEADGDSERMRLLIEARELGAARLPENPQGDLG